MTNWTKRPGVAEYGGAKAGAEGKWGQEVERLHGKTLEEVKEAAEAIPEVSFFFYCNSGMDLSDYDKGVFNAGDAVLFKGAPWYGSAPMCDTYVRERVPRNILWVSQMPDQLGGEQKTHSLKVDEADDRDFKNLQNSKYTHIIFCSFHFKDNTDFTPLYNGKSPGEYASPWEKFQLLKQGENYKTLLMSLGGWDNHCWKHMFGSEEKAARTVAEWAISHGFDGVDMNFEGTYNETERKQYRESMGQFASYLRKYLGDKIITISPIYTDVPQRDTSGNLVYHSQTWEQLAEIANWPKVLSWINLQMYVYQNAYNTGSNTTSVSVYSQTLEKNKIPPEKLVAGFALDGHSLAAYPGSGDNDNRAEDNESKLTACVQCVENIKKAHPHFGGVFVWRYLKTLHPRKQGTGLLPWDVDMDEAIHSTTDDDHSLV